MSSWAVTVAVLLLPAVVAAQDLDVPRIPPGDDRTVALEANERAPYAGVLLDADTSIRHVHRMEWLEFRLTLERDAHAAALIGIESSYERQLHTLSESYEREIAGLREDLREQAAATAEALAPPEVWETSTFSFMLGLVVSCVLAVVGVALAVSL